ncbi:MAG: sigma-70 family RNA polymerase sigma factor [Ilumatobacter sp.]
MTTPSSDADLVAGHLAGDPVALAGIYDRYADSLHDTAAAMLNDRTEAADVLQDVILIAAERLDQLRDPERLKPWLFAILRNEVYRRSRTRRRTVVTDFSGSDDGGGIDMADERIGDPGDAATDDVAGEDLAELVRNAARGLDERDQLVLELSVRQGLAGQDLADALGVSPNQSYTLVHRMRERVERSLGAFVVARAGRRDCDDLDQILASWDGEFSVLIRKRVARHIEKCDSCDRRRKTAVPFAMFAAAPAYAAPAALRDQILATAGSSGTAAAAAAGPGASTGHAAYRFDAAGGFPTAVRAARRVAAWVAPAAAAAVLIVAGGAVVTLAGSDDDQFSTVVPEISTTLLSTPAEPAPSTSDSPAATITVAPTTEPSPTSDSPSTTAPVAVGSVADTTTSPSSSAPTTTTTTTTTTTDPPVVAPPPPPPSTTSTTTTTTTTTVPPTPGELTVAGSAIDLGASSTSGSVTLSNLGELPLDFVVTGSTGAFTVTPTSGTLAGGASTQVTASIDRSGRREGDVPGATVQVVAGDATFPIVLSASVERSPSLRNARGSSSCFPTNDPNANGITIGAQVDIVDESSVTATLSVSGPSGQSGSSQMIPDGPTWFGAVNLTYPPNEPGTVSGAWSWTIRVTDSRGNTASTSGTTTPRNC